MITELKSGRVFYRQRHQIVAEILAALAQSPLNKTRIMYGAKLSYQQLCIYLPLLLKNELITAKKNGQYEITDKGKEFLRGYQAVPELDLIGDED